MDLTGETVSSYNDNATALGDSRVQLIITRDADTARLNRRVRVLVDDELSDSPLVYRIAKPFKVGQVYNNEGVYGFMMTEENLTDFDNTELMIADYYRWFDDAHGLKGSDPDRLTPHTGDDGKKRWY